MVLDFIPRNIATARRMARYAQGLLLDSWDNNPERVLVETVAEISRRVRDAVDTLEVNYHAERVRALAEELKPLHAVVRRALFMGANPNVYVASYPADAYDEETFLKPRPITAYIDEARPLLRVAAEALDPETVRLLLKYGADPNLGSWSKKDGDISLSKTTLAAFTGSIADYTARQPGVKKAVESRAAAIEDLLEQYQARKEAPKRVKFTGVDEEHQRVPPIEMVGLGPRRAPVNVMSDRRTAMHGGSSKGPAYTQAGFDEIKRLRSGLGHDENNDAHETGRVHARPEGESVTTAILQMLLAEMRREITADVVEAVSRMLRDGMAEIEDRSHGAVIAVVDQLLDEKLRALGTAPTPAPAADTDSNLHLHRRDRNRRREGEETGSSVDLGR